MPRSSKRSVKEENKMKQLKFEFMKEKDIEQRVEEIPKPLPKSSGSTGTVSSYGLSSPYLILTFHGNLMDVIKPISYELKPLPINQSFVIVFVFLDE